jgi:hydrogenase maturation protease
VNTIKKGINIAFERFGSSQYWSDDMHVKVVGCGNLLSHDEGVGIHAVRIMREGMLPPGVEIVELGKPGIDFITSLDNCQGLILLDAMAKGEKPPGTVHRFEVTQKNMEKILGDTIHGFNLVVPLKIISERKPGRLPPIVLLAMEIKERTTFGIGLSAEVKTGLEYLLDMAWYELSNLQSG